MRMIAPQVEAPTIVIAEEQEEYAPISVALVTHPEFPAVRTRHGDFNSVLMAFRPSDQERAAIAGGADIYVSLLTFGQPQQAIIVLAGKEAAAGCFDVPVSPPAPRG